MPYRYVGEEELELLKQVIDTQQCWRVGQPDGQNFVDRFEDAFAARTGQAFVHALCTGSTANQAALAGLGIGPGDEVIVTPCSYIASSLSIVALGAIPVFADVEPRALHITPESVEAAITPKTKAVVVVHNWGLPADIEPIMQVARKHNLLVTEDCAQAFDVYYHGKRAGTFGDAASYSIMQGKHLQCGEGGVVTTNDPEVYKGTVLYCNGGMPWLLRHGITTPEAQPVNGIPTRGHFAFGSNRRLSDLHGAVALAQLGKLDEFNSRRRMLVDIIEEELGGVRGLRLAPDCPDTAPNIWHYPLTLDPEQTDLTATEFVQLCEREQGVGPGLHYVYSEVNYLEEVYQEMNRQRRTSVGYPLPDYVRYEAGICPQAESAALRMIPLNVHHGMVDPDDLRTTAKAIAKTARGVIR